MKLLTKASTAGQRIYHITSANQANVLPNLNLDSNTMNEIINSLSNGKEVIAHTDILTVNGYTGAGYIIFDPLVGDGAYKISGGQNGGWLILSVFLFLAIVIIAGLFVGPVGWIFAAVAFANYIKFSYRLHQLANSNLSPDQMYDRLNQAAFTAVISTVTALIPIFRALGAIGLGLRAMLSSWIFIIDSVMWRAD